VHARFHDRLSLQVERLCTPVAYQTAKDSSLKLEAHRAALDWARGTAAETAQRLADSSTASKAMQGSPTTGKTSIPSPFPEPGQSRRHSAEMVADHGDKRSPGESSCICALACT
jgi:hypothetical protein